ncbi:MAG: hypothetical protein U0694_12820 [Anaerolineae bacterium]
MLRALASDDKDVRRHAQELLGNGNIVHQGSGAYPASIEVILFWIQLVEAPPVEDKAYLLQLLSAIGAGPDEVKERAEKPFATRCRIIWRCSMILTHRYA